MSLGDFFKSQFLDVVEFVDESDGKLLIWKYQRKYVTESGIGKDEIRHGSPLVVRNGQAAVFVSQGRIADIFGPGRYSLLTENLPLLSELDAIPSLMNSPIKSDLYFINTTQFLNNKWGTKGPVITRDEDMGMVRLMAFGNYAFRVDNISLFMNEVFGARRLNLTYDIIQFIDSFIAEAVAETLPQVKIPVLELAANLESISEKVTQIANEKAKKLGLLFSEVVVENVSVPEEVEKLIDEQSGIGLAKRDLPTYMQYQTAKAMRDAAKQEGGLAGLGAGVALGNQMASTIEQTGSHTEPDALSKLKEAKELLDTGVLNDEEFAALKKQILNL